MSQSQPNFEERERIVNAALKNLSPDNLPAAPDDLDLLMAKCEDCVRKVRALVVPIAVSVRDNGSVHSEKGRKDLLVTIHKFFVEQFSNFDRDELIFLCALVHAEIMRGEFV